MAIVSVNPATGETIKNLRRDDPGSGSGRRRPAHDAWRAWRKTPFAERARLMKKTAAILRERKTELATLMALEMGKPLKQGMAEAEKCAFGCDYYADTAEAHLAPEIIKTDASKSYVAFEPLGVILAVMPWNFPLWQVFRFAAPALMAGNVGVLKHASNVPWLRVDHRGDLLAGGIPRRHLPHVADRKLAGESGDRASARARGHAHRQHARGQGRGRAGRRGAEEDRARAWRIRSVHRAGGRRPRSRGADLRHVAPDQLRARAASTPSASSSSTRCWRRSRSASSGS